MKFKVTYIFLVACISGVIGDNPGIVVNGKNQSDVPAVSTVPSSHHSSVGPEPIVTTTTSTVAPTTNASTTSVPTTTTTIASTTKLTTTTTNATTTTVAPSTTPISNVTTSTESTTSVPTSAPSHKGRKFDGPSFIGGIILASGLMAISFVSWKFYKARTERNYHTL